MIVFVVIFLVLQPSSLQNVIDGELASCKSCYAFSVSLMSINANRTRLIDAKNK